MMASTSEMILEIRYKPNMRIIDNRGRICQEIVSGANFDQWKVNESTVEFIDNKHNEKAYIGVNNMGYIVKKPLTDNYFIDKISKFIKSSFALNEFNNSLDVLRIGLRYRFCDEFHGQFASLLRNFDSRYISLTDKAKSLMDAEVIDSGAPLNFKDKLGFFNTTCGPMEGKQIIDFFEGHSELPSVGFYFDIDYFIKPNRIMSKDEVSKQVKLFDLAAKDRYRKISDLIMKEKEE
jgi:hypothetical protein